MATLQNAINANSTTPLLPIQGGTGLSSPTAHGILVGEGASAVNPIVLTAGQILIGTTAGDPSATTLTAGTGISISSVSGAITITNTEPAGTTWSVVTTNTTLAAAHSYMANNASSLTFTLPTTAAVGDTYQVNTTNTGGWVIAQNASQSIQLGNIVTTTGTGGSITSASTTGDWIEIVCVVANNGFIANLKQGEASIV